MNLKETFKRFFAEEVNFADFKLDNGDIVRAESLEPGKAIEILQEDGTLIPAPAGEHTLEDGTIIKVEDTEDAMGIIIEVIAPEAVAEDAPAEEAPVAEEMAEEVIDEVTVEDAPVADEPVAEVIDEPTVDYDQRIGDLESVVMDIMEKLKGFEDANAEISKEKDVLVAEMSALKEENEALKSTTPSVALAKFKKIDPTKVENKEAVVKSKYAEFIAAKRK